MPPGGSRKRARTAAEIEAAAVRFAGSWVAGDSVQTWLNWHEGRLGELSELLFRGWSWADIGEALFRAGICYGTGRPIPASTLQVKASQARSKARRQRAPEPQEQPARPAPSPPIAAPAPVPPQGDDQAASAELRGEAPAVGRAVAAAPSARHRPAILTRQEGAAALAALVGKKPATAPADRHPVAAAAPRTAAAPDQAAPAAVRGLPGAAAPAEPAAKGPEQPEPAPDAADYWRDLAKGRADR